MFANALQLHDGKIEDIILDMKDKMEAFNPKIGKQRIQHCDAVKLGYLMCLTTKIEICHWTEFEYPSSLVFQMSDASNPQDTGL